MSQTLSVMQITPRPTYLFNSQPETLHLKPFLWVRACVNAQVIWEGKVTYEPMNSQHHEYDFQVSWEDGEQVLRGHVGS